MAEPATRGGAAARRGRVRRVLLVTGALAVAGCGRAAPPVAPAPEPEPLPRTATRPITDVPRRTIGFLDADLWISNELEGGRVSDAWMEGDSVVVVRIGPENAPINNSAWYAFKVWSAEPRTIRLRLAYERGRHRYWPKTRRQGGPWAPLDSAAFEPGEERDEATLRLRVGPDTLWVAGQEMMTSSFFDRWTDSLAALPHVTASVIGMTPRGRPLRMLGIGDPSATRHVMIVSRQHPPEVTGTIALVRFVEELAGDSPLAEAFRSGFRVHVVPLMNPDGVDLGHWRHNTGGVDLNRDWVDFRQPETRMVRDAFLEIMARPGAELWFGADFHSTRYDVFYTLERDLETDPAGITDRWLDYLREHLPHYDVNDDPSDLTTPTSRNWFYRRFRAPALIYEVGDTTDRALIREVAATTARGTMEILLDEAARRDAAGAGRP